MDKQELARLEKGAKLLRQIENADKRISELKKVGFINLLTSKTEKIHDERYFADDKTFERVVNYNIPLNVGDTTPHPFAKYAVKFLEQVLFEMETQKAILQEQFDDL